MAEPIARADQTATPHTAFNTVALAKRNRSQSMLSGSVIEQTTQAVSQILQGNSALKFPNGLFGNPPTLTRFTNPRIVTDRCHRCQPRTMLRAFAFVPTKASPPPTSPSRLHCPFPPLVLEALRLRDQIAGAQNSHVPAVSADQPTRLSISPPQGSHVPPFRTTGWFRFL